MREFENIVKFTDADVKRAQESSTDKNAEKILLEKGIMPQRYLNILEDPYLLGRIDAQLDKKIEGERESRKNIFLVFNMRNVANLSKASDNLMVNDEGGTGKDHVVSKVFEIIPNNEKIKKVRITPKVLAYLNDTKNNPNGWTKKCLYLEDVPNTVLNDDAFKVMASADSNGITQTSIISNNFLRNIDIKGKPSLVITIATANPKLENLRRFPINNLTSTVKQTKAIFAKQAKFAELGKSPSYDSVIKEALSHLKRVSVKVPFASKIIKHFPSGNVIGRTHFPRFIDYIKSSCALHQYQRKKDEEGYYLATEQDYEIARNMIAVTTSNELLIPLTKIQKQIREKFKTLDKEKFYSFQELEKKMQNIASPRWLRMQIEKLAEFGFLKRSNEKKEDSIKKIAVFRYNSDLSNIDLPKFKDLDSSANKDSLTNNTITAYNANKEEKPSPSNLHDLHHLHGALKSQPSIYHKCFHCGKDPCIEFDKNGSPICEECLKQNEKIK